MTAPGNRRNNAERVAALHRCLLLLQIADVLVVQVDIDEVPQLALLRVEVLLQAVVLLRQVGEELADGGAADFDGLELVGERAERRGNVNRVCHSRSVRLQADLNSSSSNAERSSFN